MIFVTVGTHEQPFDRLLQALDDLNIPEEIVAQTGYSAYEPRRFKSYKMLSSDDMNRLMREARIVITHGGPGSIMAAFEHSKIPIVVPRQYAHGEHVNDHQVVFTRSLQEARRALVVYDIGQLGEVIDRYDELVQGCVRPESQEAATRFCSRFEGIVERLFSGKTAGDIRDRQRFPSRGDAQQELKCAIICSNSLKSLINPAHCPDVSFHSMFKAPLNKIQWSGLIALLHFNAAPLYRKMYNPELADLSARTIIVFDSHVRRDFLLWLQHNNPDHRLIFWYWNSVHEVSRHLPPTMIPYDYEKWTYSFSDSLAYGMRFNTTFYHGNRLLPDVVMDRDVVFVGTDKGRMADLLRLKEQFEAMGLVVDFHIVKTKKYHIDWKKRYAKSISYEAVLERVAHSRAILDYCPDDTVGLSLRPMEALFFRKKLITNNQEILKAPFYCQENVFILGRDDLSRLSSMLEAPFHPVDLEAKQFYAIQNWIGRFFEGVDTVPECGQVADVSL